MPVRRARIPRYDETPCYDYIRAPAALLVLFGQKGKMPGGYIGVSIFLCLPSIEKAAPSHVTPRQDGGGINRPAQDRTAPCVHRTFMLVSM